MTKTTTVSKFQQDMAAEREAEQSAERTYINLGQIGDAVASSCTAETLLGEIVGQIRTMANQDGLYTSEPEIRDQAQRIFDGLRDDPYDNANPLDGLTPHPDGVSAPIPADDVRVADPFVGMDLEIEPLEAYGMIQAKVRGWLDDRGTIAQEDEIRAKTNDLYGAAQSTAPVRDWRRPVLAEATYTVAPDGLVGDYEIKQAERELPGMPGHPETPNAEPVGVGRMWDPAVWGKVVDPAGKATLLWDIPQNREFTNGQLKRAIDLDEMVDALIRTVRPLSMLAPLTIGWYWKLKGGRSRGKPVLTRVAPADKTLAYERQCDVVVHLSADHLRKMKASALFVERLVFDALARIDPAGPRVNPDDEWARLPGRWRYGWLGPDERLYADLVAQIDGGHDDDTTVDLDAPAAESLDKNDPENYSDPMGNPPPDPMPADGLLIHDDGTPLTAAEIAEQEAAELRDDPAPDDDTPDLLCAKCGEPVMSEEFDTDDLAAALLDPKTVLCEDCGEISDDEPEG